MRRDGIWILALLMVLSVACSGGDGGGGTKDVADSTLADAADSSSLEDTTGKDLPGDLPDAVDPLDCGELPSGHECNECECTELGWECTSMACNEDVKEDTEVVDPMPELPTQAPLAKPADPLDGKSVESCALYQEETCVGGELRRCQVYDVASEAFVEDVDPLLERVFLYDRWRDLYNSPDGQAVDRDFIGEVMPGVQESEWGSPDKFEAYWGAGDGGIWTGWSTVASILRYAQTGTRADYARMEQQVRDLVTMYDVTGVPGYLCRYHFLLLPEGAPNDPDHILRWENTFTGGHHDRLVPNPENIENLPDLYTQGITDDEGKVWTGTPMWHGRPSIDQNSGPMTALPMAYALLEDEALKEKISHHLTCYLKRLQRIEIINLQENPELVEGLLAYFSVGELQLDPDDMDLTELDKIVGYVQRQVNSKNEDDFDFSCPDTVQLEPWRVIDAASDEFFGDLLALVSDMDTDAERPNTIDHYYWPSIRGGDAMHMMHLATMAYYMTGDEQYRSFLYDELIGNINTIAVAHTTGAFDLPKFCKKYFGDQITFGPWWAFLHLLGDCDLKTEMMKAYDLEFWQKLMKNVGNVDFDIMYAGAVDPAIATEADVALEYAMEQLPWMGSNGGTVMGEPNDAKWLTDPRRRYSMDPNTVLAAVPEGTEAVCPTQHEVDICTAQVKILGIDLGNLTGWSTHDCIPDNPYECVISDGQCVRAMTNNPLPVHLRNSTDYLWQRNAFDLGGPAGEEGARQYAGSDYSVPFWNARRYGFIDDGEGQVLAWKPVGNCD